MEKFDDLFRKYGFHYVVYTQTTYDFKDKSKVKNTSVDEKLNLKELNDKLEKLVSEQKFEEAAVIRDLINGKSKSIEERITSLKSELEKVIKDENYERAIEIREELKNLNGDN